MKIIIVFAVIISALMTYIQGQDSSCNDKRSFCSSIFCKYSWYSGCDKTCGRCGGGNIDQCKSMVTQCAVSTLGDACAYLKCINQVVFSPRCPRTSPYRAKMASLTRKLIPICYSIFPHLPSK